jgi:hypothetical protein
MFLFTRLSLLNLRHNKTKSVLIINGSYFLTIKNQKIMNLPIQAKPVSRTIIATEAPSEGINPSVCVGGSANGNQICVNVPVLGRKCITSPIRLPVGASVRGCTCSFLGVPCGVKITATVAGRTLFSKGIGCC